MNWESLSQTIIGSALGAGLLAKIIEKIWDEWRDSSKKSIIAKEELKKEIIKICAEASSCGYKKLPRSREHTQYVIDSLYGIDYILASELEIFVLKWCFYSEMEAVKSKTKSITKEFSNHPSVPSINSPKDTFKPMLENTRREIIKLTHKMGNIHIQL
jgi:adenine-specific DNA methylase